MIKHISFAGIDKKTNVNELIKLQKDFPLAEFGFLSSKNWAENGNRYPNPVFLKSLKGKDLHLSLHLCGRFARITLNEGWSEIEEFFGKDLDIFQRIQLNVIGMPLKKDYDLPHIANAVETIIQQRSILEIPIYENYLAGDYDESIHTTTSILFDISGGRGIYDKDFDVVEIDRQVKHGFAGGISPANCVEVIKHIEESLNPDVDYWIDMESGIRDDNDWFSVDKCRQVCEKVYSYLHL